MHEHLFNCISQITVKPKVLHTRKKFQLVILPKKTKNIPKVMFTYESHNILQSLDQLFIYVIVFMLLLCVWGGGSI